MKIFRLSPVCLNPKVEKVTKRCPGFAWGVAYFSYLWPFKTKN